MSMLFRAASSIALGLFALGAAQAQSFNLWVTETPAGGTPAFANQFLGGVRSYTFDGLGYGAANYSAGPVISAASLNDASDVQVAADGSLLVANRGFNSGPGSVSRVTFSAGVPNAPTTLLANIDTGPHQLAITGSGDLVASSFTLGGKLYPGMAAPASTSFATGAQRGAVTYGNQLYATNGSNAVNTFNLSTGAAAGSFSVAGASLLHCGTQANSDLWFADIGNGVTGAGGGVYRVALDVQGLPVGSVKVADVDGAISVTFSPSGDEMFVAGHFSGLITGFAVGPGYSIAASSNLVIDGGTLASWNNAHVSYGGMAVSAVPEPAGYGLGLAGIGLLVGVARRRAKADEGDRQTKATSGALSGQGMLAA